MTADTFLENSYYSGLNRYLDQYWEDRLQNEYQPKGDFSLQQEEENKWVVFLPEPVSLSKGEIGAYLKKLGIVALLLDEQAISLSLLQPCNGFDDQNYLLRACDLLLGYQKDQLELTAARIEAQMAQTRYRLLQQQVQRKFYSEGLKSSVVNEPAIQIYAALRRA